MKDTVHVILGAAGGIGSATARRLAAQGARLVLGGRSLDGIEQLATQVEGVAKQLDATETSQVKDAVAYAVDRFGRIDGIVNCVGSLLLKPAHITSDDEWDETIATNLRSAFATVKAGAAAMRQDGGSIVLLTSAAAQIGIANHEAIAAAKGGVIGLTLSAAATYASKQIRVNAVAPGLVRTPLTARLTANAKSEDASLAMHAIGRLGEPEDVAAAIEFLLNPGNDWVTGQILGVDGGLGSIRTRS